MIRSMNPYDINTLDPSLVQTTPINPLEMLGISTAMVSIFLITSTVITLLFFVLFLVNIIRNWKVQKAIFAMQKDIREMNESMKKSQQPTPPSAAPSAPPTPSQAE